MEKKFEIPKWLVGEVRSYRSGYDDFEEEEGDTEPVSPGEALAYLISEGFDIGDAGMALDLSGVGGDEAAEWEVLAGLDLSTPLHPFDAVAANANMERLVEAGRRAPQSIGGAIDRLPKGPGPTGTPTGESWAAKHRRGD